MIIKEIMTSGFEMISASENLYEASRKMKQLNVGVLPVNEGNNLIGLITDRDIVVRCLAEEKDPSECRVKDIISAHIITVSQQSDISEAVSLMESNKVRRLIVIDEKNTPVGILSLGDIAVRCQGAQAGGEVLECVSQPQ